MSWPVRTPVSPAPWLSSAHMRANDAGDSSDFGLLAELLGSNVPQKWEIHCLGSRWTAVLNLTPLALYSAEKSVTAQANQQTKLETVTDISTPCLMACVDKKVSFKDGLTYLNLLTLKCRRLRENMPRGIQNNAYHKNYDYDPEVSTNFKYRPTCNIGGKK